MRMHVLRRVSVEGGTLSTFASAGVFSQVFLQVCMGWLVSPAKLRKGMSESISGHNSLRMTCGVITHYCQIYHLLLSHVLTGFCAKLITNAKMIKKNSFWAKHCFEKQRFLLSWELPWNQRQIWAEMCIKPERKKKYFLGATSIIYLEG